MSGDDRAAPGSEPPHDGEASPSSSGLQRWLKAVFDRTPWGRRLNRYGDRLHVIDRRLDAVEHRLDALEDGVRLTQTEIAELRDERLVDVGERLGHVESRVDDAEAATRGVSEETARLRDRVVPAAVGRSDALLERLAAELDEVASLVERMLRREPLPSPARSSLDDQDLASALAAVQPALLESFRGTEAEVRHRLDHYLGALRSAPPVLDLGCGRGELLLMLREAGVEAAGIEGDAALAGAARRRGLEIVEGDALDALREQPDASRGAVTAIHLFEHLSPARLLAVLAEAHRVLRPGGLLIAEFPNPHSLRVGASLYWIDPTHRRPLLPETFELYLRTSGFEIDRRELLHPFPSDQQFGCRSGKASFPDAEPGTVEASLDSLCRKLDELINGARDVAVWARRPGTR